MVLSPRPETFQSEQEYTKSVGQVKVDIPVEQKLASDGIVPGPESVPVPAGTGWYMPFGACTAHISYDLQTLSDQVGRLTPL